MLPSAHELADACRGVRERLETIVRALASLRVEIERTLQAEDTARQPRIEADEAARPGD